MICVFVFVIVFVCLVGKVFCVLIGGGIECLCVDVEDVFVEMIFVFVLYVVGLDE